MMIFIEFYGKTHADCKRSWIKLYVFHFVQAWA